MKKHVKLNIGFVVAFVLLSLVQSQLRAQTAANGIIFQAVARDQYSNPAKDRKIFVQSSIIQSTESGVKVLIEEHETTTDASGVFGISVGQGKRLGGTVTGLNLVDWAQGPYFLNLKIAITPIAPVTGWDYTKDLIDLGTSPFGTVPYALYAGNVFGLDKKLNIADSTKYVTPTQLNAKTFDQTPILNAIVTKLNVADSIKYYVTPSQLAAKTFDITPITNDLSLKLKITDTAFMLNSRFTRDTINLSKRIDLKLNKSDTASLSNRINLKVNISDTASMLANYLRKIDTAVFSRKSMPAYSIRANNTSGTADATNFTFRSVGAQSISSGVPTWTAGTAPSGTENHSYTWSQIGKQVTVIFYLTYVTAGATCTAVSFPLPTDLPLPLELSGTGAADEFLYIGSGYIGTAKTTTPAVTSRPVIKVNSGDTGYDISMSGSSVAARVAYGTITYTAQ